MGPTWGRQDPGGSNVGHVYLAIWDGNTFNSIIVKLVAQIDTMSFSCEIALR